MTHIAYLTFPIVTEDKISERRLRRLAKDAEDAFNVTVEADQIGLVKKSDVPYDLPDAFGHYHYSDPPAGEVCAHQPDSCYTHCNDGFHPTDN